MTPVPKPQHKRRAPKRGQRGRISKDQYQLALDWFGDSCAICNDQPIEMHHVTFRSAGGRGGYRNLMPLCNQHHTQAHQDRGFADSLRQERAEAFGLLYYTDAHDLYDADLIAEPTDAAFENYMRKQERK